MGCEGVICFNVWKGWIDFNLGGISVCDKVDFSYVN